MTMDNLNNFLPDFDKAVTHFKSDLSTLRTNRANPAILDKVIVEAYGVPTPLVQLASITLAEARSIMVAPWDKSTIKDIEKAIIAANLSLSPVNEGTQLRLTMPQLTEESRKELVKTLHQKMEQVRQLIRKVRDHTRDKIMAEAKDKIISEDKKFDLLKKLDELTQKYNDQIKTIGEAKAKEIMTV